MNVVACPSCSQQLQFSPQQAGQQVRCPNCQAVLVLPQLQTAQHPGIGQSSQPVVSQSSSATNEDPTPKFDWRQIHPGVLWGSIGGGVLLILISIALLVFPPRDDVDRLFDNLEAANETSKQRNLAELSGPVPDTNSPDDHRTRGHDWLNHIGLHFLDEEETKHALEQALAHFEQANQLFRSRVHLYPKWSVAKVGTTKEFQTDFYFCFPQVADTQAKLDYPVESQQKAFEEAIDLAVKYKIYILIPPLEKVIQFKSDEAKANYHIARAISFLVDLPYVRKREGHESRINNEIYSRNAEAIARYAQSQVHMQLVSMSGSVLSNLKKAKELDPDNPHLIEVIDYAIKIGREECPQMPSGAKRFEDLRSEILTEAEAGLRQKALPKNETDEDFFTNRFVCPDQNNPNALPIWGHKNGVQIGLAPTPGPQGLIRVYAPHLNQPHPRPINYVSIEPTVKGQKGRDQSELQESRDRPGERGLSFWASNTKEWNPQAPKTPTGVYDKEARLLRLYIHSETFTNGAKPIVECIFDSKTPKQVQFILHAGKDSSPMTWCTLSATMGNYSLLNRIQLKSYDRPTADQSWKGVLPEANGFLPWKFWRSQTMNSTNDGMKYATLNSIFSEPAKADYDDNVPAHWRYSGTRSYLRWITDPADKLMVAVNGRRMYYGADAEIPGGTSFENFELRVPFKQGLRLWLEVGKDFSSPLIKTD